MKDSILVFGGGLLQLSIIKRIQNFGYPAIVIDPDETAPAREIADFFFRVGGNDFETTKRIALDFNVKGIVTSATDKPILMMCRIAEELGFLFPSYRSCETVLNKAKFKRFMEGHNMAHADGREYHEGDTLSDLNIDFPVIVKPVMNSGSRGVIKCEDSLSLDKAINETLIHCGNKNFLIEEFVIGDEVSVEVLVQYGKVQILQITDKIVTEPPYNVELGHIQPSRYLYLKDEITDLLQAVVDKLGLDNCALHPELKINGNRITIIEIGPRLGGDFITSHLVPLSTGVNMEDQLIKISLGIPTTYGILP